MARKNARRLPSLRYATTADVAEIHRILDDRKAWLERLEKTCSVQFERIAQLQAELDLVRRAWERKQARLEKKRQGRP
jgi:hypothetical protein